MNQYFLAHLPFILSIFKLILELSTCFCAAEVKYEPNKAVIFNCSLYWTDTEAETVEGFVFLRRTFCSHFIVCK